MAEKASMNKSFLFGIFVVSSVIYFGILSHAKSPLVFLDPHAILIVIGGTLAAGFIAFQGQSLTRVLDFVIWGALFRRKRRYLKVAKDIAVVRSSYLTGKNPPNADTFDPFLREGIEFLFDRKTTSVGLVDLLRTRSSYFSKLYRNDAKVLASLAKYPPAFGLLGAATGMIEMMQNLGGGGSAGIGQAMAVALVATFWGIAIANFFILPLADAATRASQDDATLRDLIIDGLKLIKDEVGDQQFKGHLRGYLSLEERHNFNVIDTFVRPTMDYTSSVPQSQDKIASLDSVSVESIDLRLGSKPDAKPTIDLLDGTSPSIHSTKNDNLVGFDRGTDPGTQITKSLERMEGLSTQVINNIDKQIKAELPRISGPQLGTEQTNTQTNTSTLTNTEPHTSTQINTQIVKGVPEVTRTSANIEPIKDDLTQAIDAATAENEKQGDAARLSTTNIITFPQPSEEDELSFVKKVKK